jgi:hypothetical protein
MMLSTTTKVKLGAKGARGTARHPGMVRAGVKGGTAMGRMAAKVTVPIAKRRARRRIAGLADTARDIGQTLVTYGPDAAVNLGLIEPPKRKRTAPKVAAGAVLGASAMYFLEPEHGKEHREKVAQLVS